MPRERKGDLEQQIAQYFIEHAVRRNFGNAKTTIGICDVVGRLSRSRRSDSVLEKAKRIAVKTLRGRK